MKKYLYAISLIFLCTSFAVAGTIMTPPGVSKSYVDALVAASGGVSQSDCSTITSGTCLDTDDGKLYVWNGTAVVLATTAIDADFATWSGITPGANVATFLATPSSANFFSAISDEGAFASTLFGYANAAAVASGIGVGTEDTPTFAGVSIAATASGPQLGYFLEDSDNGSNYVGIAAAASVTNDLILLLPSTADPLAGQILTFAVPGAVTFSDNIARDASQASWAYPGASLTPVIDDPDNFGANFTGANLYGGTFIANAAGTAALPDPAVGMNFSYVLEGANANIIDPLGTGTADTIVMNGTAATADENITSSTTGAICVFQYRAANSWMATCNDFAEANP